MSTGMRQRANSNSIKTSSVRSQDIKIKPPTPGQDEFAFEPCAATGSFLLYAQRNVILCLHHDTLKVERRFDRHREDVSWISVDTTSERGAGRLVVSYDAGSTAIVWDMLTGDEVARFASYEQIRVATWMRNGNVAFGECSGAAVAPAVLVLTLDQETRRATSSSSNLPHLNTSQRELSSIPLQHWHRRPTAEPSQLAISMDQF
jgi:hypothetical protein